MRVLARVDMVLMGPAEPLKVPLTLGVEGGELGMVAGSRADALIFASARTYEVGLSAQHRMNNAAT